MSKNKKVSVIIGVTGQDGSYLAEFLLSLNHEVIGIIRRKSVGESELWRIKHLLNNPKFKCLSGDITDQGFIVRLVRKKPDFFFNLAAMSFVKESFNTPFTTMKTNAIAVFDMLEAIRIYSPKTRFFQASSSEMYGNNKKGFLNEESELTPVSPYGLSKQIAHNAVKIARDAYGLFACSGISFNHGSPRRGEEFVTRKISLGVANIKFGFQKKIRLGNIKAKRDWGFSGDYVKAYYKMLMMKKPKDYVIATGEAHSVEDFLREAFAFIGIKNWRDYITIDKKYFRPTDINILLGDSSRAKKELCWQPKTKFKELVRMMVESDMEIIEKKNSNEINSMMIEVKEDSRGYLEGEVKKER